MRASRVLAVTATACAAVAFSAPLASATGGPVNVRINPYTVHQGGTLRITVDGCNRGGTVTSNAFPRVQLTAGRTQRPGGGARRAGPADADSQGGADGADQRQDQSGQQGDQGQQGQSADAGASGRLSAVARIYDRATPGTYNLAVRCNDNSRVVTKQFTVVAGLGALGGLGGSVGPDSTETAVGAGLVTTAAVGGSLFVVRRRRTVGDAF
jgi:hypothetical protein